MPQSYLQLENVSKRFDDFVAVNNVSLSIERGEIFCLLGGSGCGKTTLLRMLAGFETPSAGGICIDGAGHERDAALRAAGQHDVPVVRAVPAHERGEERRLRPGAGGLGAREIKRRVGGDPRDRARWARSPQRKPHQLSGGQRQRVALARALVKRPKLLLLDEPLAALDRKLREHTQFELINIQQRLGVTFIVVTHDQEEAMTLATRIGVMDHGEIVQVGTPRQIYEFPATRFVADFIGSVNLFEGRLVEDEPRLRAGASARSCRLHGAASITASARRRTRRLWIAVRPEKDQAARASRQARTADNWAHGVVTGDRLHGGLVGFLVRMDSGARCVRRCQQQPQAGRAIRARRVGVSELGSFQSG